MIIRTLIGKHWDLNIFKLNTKKSKEKPLAGAGELVNIKRVHRSLESLKV